MLVLPPRLSRAGRLRNKPRSPDATTRYLILYQFTPFLCLLFIHTGYRQNMVKRLSSLKIQCLLYFTISREQEIIIAAKTYQIFKFSRFFLMQEFNYFYFTYYLHYTETKKLKVSYLLFQRFIVWLFNIIAWSY